MIHNLKHSPYTFNSEVGTYNNRFILKFTNNVLGLEESDTLNGINIFEHNEKLIIKSDFESIIELNIFDILGRTIYKNKNINSKSLLIETLQPSKSALFLKIKLADGSFKVAKIIF